MFPPKRRGIRLQGGLEHLMSTEECSAVDTPPPRRPQVQRLAVYQLIEAETRAQRDTAPAPARLGPGADRIHRTPVGSLRTTKAGAPSSSRSINATSPSGPKASGMAKRSRRKGSHVLAIGLSARQSARRSAR